MTPRARRRVALALAALTLPVVVLTACTTASSTSGATTTGVPASPTSANPYGSAPVDPPGPTEPVLTVTGPRGTTTYTLAELEALGTRTVTVNEPFVKAVRTFTGVPMQAVLDAAGIPPTATVETVALNDYRYSTTAEAFTGSEALIATEQDGGPVPYDQGGPIRLVFADGSELSSVLDAGKWSLTSMVAVT